MYAPVVIFLYNRPDHTQKTIEALQQNNLALDSDLFIYSDAAKTEEELEAVSLVREYISNLSGFKSITIVHQKKNLGLAESIVQGVTFVVEKYGSVIVLEDDIVTSSCFLEYMNRSLNVYKTNKKVMHISGYMFPISTSDLPETFFLRNTTCWGWATWDSAWSYFRKNSASLIQEFSPSEIKEFNMEGAYDFWSQVKLNHAGKINTWAVFWYASVFKQNGLCLHPAASLVNNIGHDSSGQHCAINNNYFVKLTEKKISYYEKNISVNRLAYFRTKEFFKKIKPTLLQRLTSFLKRRIGSHN